MEPDLSVGLAGKAESPFVWLGVVRAVSVQPWSGETLGTPQKGRRRGHNWSRLAARAFCVLKQLYILILNFIPDQDSTCSQSYAAPIVHEK